MNRIAIEAPAKINLGLEILGRREDGYHEIRTVLAMLELADTLTLEVSETPGGEEIDGIPSSENLVTRALEAFKSKVPDSSHLTWSLTKRIPSAAGLGGASSDAASALIAANTLAGSPLSVDELAGIAGTLGSDITFFLGNACAVASGRGTELAQVPAFKANVLLVVPRETLPAKTAMMYRALNSSDFSTGLQVNEIVTRLETGIGLENTQLVNTFSRPLRSLLPRIGELQQAFRSLGNFAWALSGAGPAHYVLAPEAAHGWIIDALTSQFGDWLMFISTSTRLDPVSCEGGQP